MRASGGLPDFLDIIGGGDQRRGRAVDDGRGIAAGLHAAEARPDGGERLHRRRTHMGIGAKLLGALELELTRAQPRAFEGLAFHRRDLAAQKAGFLRGERALEALRGKGVDLRARDLIRAREILRRVAHAHIARRVEQRLQEKILELDATHAKAAHAVGNDRVAAHGFGADAKRKVDLPVADAIGRLHEHLDAGAADPLDHVGGHLDRNAGI
jgi:hypothetical protein